MLKGFQDFIAKGNLIQLAVAFVMGVAFSGLISSFVNDLIMPIIGKLVGNVDFANLYINLSGQNYESAAAAREAGAAAIYYGVFVNTLISFLLIAFVLYLIVRAYMRTQKPAEAPAPSTKECPFCHTAMSAAAATRRSPRPLRAGSERLADSIHDDVADAHLEVQASRAGADRRVDLLRRHSVLR